MTRFDSAGEPRPSRLKGCAGKQGIPTRELAEKVARRMRKAHKAKLRLYRCHECGDWHVGTPK